MFRLLHNNTTAELSTRNRKLAEENRKLAEENRKLAEKNRKLAEENRDIKHEVKELKDKIKIYLERLKKLDKFENRQAAIFFNKLEHGFNTTNVYQEARYILEEVAELMRAIEKDDRENMKEELADIVIFSYGCAEVAKLPDLDAEIFKKMDINKKRLYTMTAEGDFIKTDKTKK